MAENQPQAPAAGKAEPIARESVEFLPENNQKVRVVIDNQEFRVNGFMEIYRRDAEGNEKLVLTYRANGDQFNPDVNGDNPVESVATAPKGSPQHRSAGSEVSASQVHSPTEMAGGRPSLTGAGVAGRGMSDNAAPPADPLMTRATRAAQANIGQKPAVGTPAVPAEQARVVDPTSSPPVGQIPAPQPTAPEAGPAHTNQGGSLAGGSASPSTSGDADSGGTAGSTDGGSGAGASGAGGTGGSGGSGGSGGAGG